MGSLAGQRLGRFEIEAEIGQGGMGTVYRARQTDLNRPVALKVLDPNLQKDLGFVARFLRESQVLAQLSHPNVVHVYESGETNGVLYYAMELVEGETLDEVLRAHRRLDSNEAVRIVAHICRGLQAVHNAGAIHRDVKPSNIAINEQGAAKLMDFGLAIQSENTRLTKVGSVIGTPLYMSPEQTRGQALDARSDIYSLGVVLYEALTGAPPFDSDNTLETLQLHQNADPVAPRDINETVSPALNEIVMIMLRKDPAERFQSCSDVIRALRVSLKDSEATALLATPATGIRLGYGAPLWSGLKRLAPGLILGCLLGAVVISSVSRGSLDTEDQPIRTMSAVSPVVPADSEETATAATPPVSEPLAEDGADDTASTATASPNIAEPVALVPRAEVYAYLEWLYDEAMELQLRPIKDATRGRAIGVRFRSGAVLFAGIATRVGDTLWVRLPSFQEPIPIPVTALKSSPTVALRADVLQPFRQAWIARCVEEFQSEPLPESLSRNRYEELQNFAAANLPPSQRAAVDGELRALQRAAGHTQLEAAAIRDLTAALDRANWWLGR